MKSAIPKIIDKMCELEAYIEFLENKICGITHTNNKELDIKNYNKATKEYKQYKKQLNKLSGELNEI